MKSLYFLCSKIPLLVVFVFSSALLLAQTQVFTDNTSGTRNWQVPANVTSLTVEAWGGGGGGGGSSTNNSRGSGGGSGGYSTRTLTVTPGSTINYTVGTAGTAGGSGNGAVGGTGGATSILGLTANGGTGGGRNNSATVGQGGTAIGGTTNTTGNPGIRGNTSGNGGNAPAAGGTGGIGSTDAVGGIGNPPGGGGGGGESNGNNRNGGAGGSGGIKITYTYSYVAQIISVSPGSTTWCAGETRDVSVTIKNIGSKPWTDVAGVDDFNIGVKWNTNGASWNDYNVRVDAQNLAPGATATYTLPITASTNVGGVYGNELPYGTNNLTFDVVYEEKFWFGNNNGGGGPGNSVSTTPNQNILRVPKTYTIVQAESPTGTDACTQDYVKLDIAGMPTAVPFEEKGSPLSYSWTKYGFSTGGANPISLGVDMVLSNTNLAGGTASEFQFIRVNNGYTGDWYIYPNTGVTAEYLPISLDGYSAANISFKSRFQANNNNSTRNIYVDISTDAVNWNILWSTQNIGNNANIVATPTVDLSTYLGATVYIRFRFSGTSDGLTTWSLDDFKIAGTIPPVAWSPIAGLYTDAALTIPYVAGADVRSLYAAPNGSQLYTLSTSISPCAKSRTSTVVHNKKKFTAATGNWSVNSNWFPLGAPLSPTYADDRCVHIPNGTNVIVNVPNAVAKSVEIETGGKLTISSSQILTVTDAIINNAGNANFVVESDANLVQTNDLAVNTGGITVHRISPMKKNNYTYWSSPVSGQELKAFSLGTAQVRFYQYIESTNLFQTVLWTDKFTPGKGYAIMAPSTYTTTQANFDGVFKGVPTNGTKKADTSPLEFPLELTLITPNRGFNMIGNPYPSNIDFEVLYALNSTKIYNTAYFWTNVDPKRPSSTNGNGDAYTGNAYAIYNGTGGVPATTPGPGTGDGGTSETPTQFIKVGQGFIVKAKQSGQLIFNNSIRNAVGSSNFFSKGASSDKDRFWLKLTTPAQNVNTILIGYIAGATNDFERDYDAPLMSVASDSFYSILNENKLGIQGKTYPLNTSDVVPLGTKHFEDGNYTVSLGDKEGIFANGQSIYLKDNQTGIITNLIQGSYTFAAIAGENTARFEIIYQPGTVLVTDAVSKEEIVVYRDGEDFVVKSQAKKITNLEMYDPNGRLLLKTKPNTTKTIIPAQDLVRGVYFLKITQDTKVTMKRVIR